MVDDRRLAAADRYGQDALGGAARSQLVLWISQRSWPEEMRKKSQLPSTLYSQGASLFMTFRALSGGHCPLAYRLSWRHGNGSGRFDQWGDCPFAQRDGPKTSARIDQPAVCLDGRRGRLQRRFHRENHRRQMLGRAATSEFPGILDRKPSRAVLHRRKSRRRRADPSDRLGRALSFDLHQVDLAPLAP